MPMATGVATPFPPFAQKYSVYFNFTRQRVRARNTCSQHPQQFAERPEAESRRTPPESETDTIAS